MDPDDLRDGWGPVPDPSRRVRVWAEVERQLDRRQAKPRWLLLAAPLSAAAAVAVAWFIVSPAERGPWRGEAIVTAQAESVAELDHLEAKGASPEVQAELSRAMAVVGGLPAELRMPYVLRYVEGMTVPEIAQATSWSERTIKRRIQAAVLKLEKRGGPHGSR